MTYFGQDGHFPCFDNGAIKDRTSISAYRLVEIQRNVCDFERESLEISMHYVYLIIAIVCEVTATSALKASDGFTQWVPSSVVVVGYAAAFYFLGLVLQRMSIGIAYAIWAGVGIVLVGVVGRVVYDQRLDLAAMTGMALIITGVAVINLWSSAQVQ